MIHDFKAYPELTDAQMSELELISPFQQIKESFNAFVTKVHDGDTITLTTTFRDFEFPLRFLDIDAPEMNNGGDKAKDWLKEQIEGQDVYIEIDPNNRVGKYGRLLGRVIHRGLNMGDTEIRLGLTQPFGKKLENQLPNIDKELGEKKWFTI